MFDAVDVGVMTHVQWLMSSAVMFTGVCVAAVTTSTAAPSTPGTSTSVMFASTNSTASSAGQSTGNPAIDLGNLLPQLFNGVSKNNSVTLDPASVLMLLKNLGNLVQSNQVDTGAQPQAVVNFLHSLVQLLPGNNNTAAANDDVTAEETTAVASDLPTAAIALLTALGKVLPQPNTPVSLTNLLNFFTAVGNFIKIIANKVPPPAASS